MSGYQVKEFGRITRAVVSPVTAMVLAPRLPSPEQLAASLASAPPEHRATIQREIDDLRLAAVAYGAQRPARMPVASVPEPWVKAGEAAAALGCDRKTVVAYIKTGQLEGRQPGKLWWVKRDSLDALMVAKTPRWAA